MKLNLIPEILATAAAITQPSSPSTVINMDVDMDISPNTQVIVSMNNAWASDPDNATLILTVDGKKHIYTQVSDANAQGTILFKIMNPSDNQTLYLQISYNTFEGKLHIINHTNQTVNLQKIQINGVEEKSTILKIYQQERGSAEYFTGNTYDSNKWPQSFDTTQKLELMYSSNANDKNVQYEQITNLRKIVLHDNSTELLGQTSLYNITINENTKDVYVKPMSSNVPSNFIVGIKLYLK